MIMTKCNLEGKLKLQISYSYSTVREMLFRNTDMRHLLLSKLPNQAMESYNSYVLYSILFVIMS